MRMLCDMSRGRSEPMKKMLILTAALSLLLLAGCGGGEKERRG